MSAKCKVKKGDSCVVFDGQCPFCRAYVASLEGREGNNPAGLHKIDARSAPELVAQLAAQNIDINTGIVLIKDEGSYQGAEALSLLARGHATRGWFRSLHHYLLRYRLLSFVVYPVLRTIRNTYLCLVRRAAIKTGIR